MADTDRLDGYKNVVTTDPVELGKSTKETINTIDTNFDTLIDFTNALNDGKENAIGKKKSAFNRDFYNGGTDALKENNTPNAGVSDLVARIDHVHPSDSSKQNRIVNGKELIVNNHFNVELMPDSLLGQLEYKGVWDPSTQVSAPVTASTAQKGWYYIANNSGKILPDNTTYSGEAFETGDWVVIGGISGSTISWDKVDNTDAIKLVNGQRGDVRVPLVGYFNYPKYSYGATSTYLDPTGADWDERSYNYSDVVCVQVDAKGRYYIRTTDGKGNIVASEKNEAVWIRYSDGPKRTLERYTEQEFKANFCTEEGYDPETSYKNNPNLKPVGDLKTVFYICTSNDDSGGIVQIIPPTMDNYQWKLLGSGGATSVVDIDKGIDGLMSVQQAKDLQELYDFANKNFPRTDNEILFVPVAANTSEVDTVENIDNLPTSGVAGIVYAVGSGSAVGAGTVTIVDGRIYLTGENIKKAVGGDLLLKKDAITEIRVNNTALTKNDLGGNSGKYVNITVTEFGDEFTEATVGTKSYGGEDYYYFTIKNGSPEFEVYMEKTSSGSTTYEEVFIQKIKESISSDITVLVAKVGTTGSATAPKILVRKMRGSGISGGSGSTGTKMYLYNVSTGVYPYNDGVSRTTCTGSFNFQCICTSPVSDNSIQSILESVGSANSVPAIGYLDIPSETVDDSDNLPAETVAIRSIRYANSNYSYLNGVGLTSKNFRTIPIHNDYIGPEPNIALDQANANIQLDVAEIYANYYK